jgi:signal transduction histidine kinase
MNKSASKLGTMAGVAALYLLAGYFGTLLASGNPKVTPIWPASGVALGLMLLSGRWIWPGIFCGAFVISLASHYGAGTGFALVAGPFGAAIGNTFEILVACWLVERFAAGTNAFQHPRTVFLFIALAAVLSTALSAIIGTVGLSAAGLLPWQRFGLNWLTWWLSHMVSVIVITPAMVVWKGTMLPKCDRAKWLQAAALMLLLLLVSVAIFGDWLPNARPELPSELKFLAAPVLLWGAFRFGLRGATGCTLLLAAIAIFETLTGRAASLPVMQDLRLLQVFLAVIAIMSVVVAADVTQRLQAEAGRNACELRYNELYQADLQQRKRSEAALKASNEKLDRLKQLEQRVHERTAQLESVNKELESFAFSVSHDLRAPLRSIRGFSEVVLQHFSEQLDPRGREYLRRVCESSEQMDRLIEDLLKFSRVTRAELHWQPVNLSALVASIATELQQAEPERKVQFAIAQDLHTSGDEHLLRIVLDNLLRNAWKFTGKRANPRIEFGISQNDGRTPAYFVRDNGAGFSMKHAHKLFGVFQRLHSTSEFPGTGVGLATVQRIINRHGGRIWPTAAVEQGATFYFTLAGPATGPSPPQASASVPLIDVVAPGAAAQALDDSNSDSERSPAPDTPEPAAYVLSGVRPSSAAEMPECLPAVRLSSALKPSEVAEAEDGRTPLNAYPAAIP